jgi:hypothetical protein
MMLGTEAPSKAVGLLEDGIARFRTLGDSVATADALNNLANALLLEVGDTARAAARRRGRAVMSQRQELWRGLLQEHFP